MARIFLTGATGFVGSHVLPVLLGRGHAVTALARTEKSAAALRARYPTAASALQVHRGDVANPTTLTGALRDHDVVVHLVALARDWSGGADLDRINVGGTAALLDAASRCRAAKVVGLMTLPPVPDTPEDARPWFRRLRTLRDEWQAAGVPGSMLRELSMGMSGDFEVAVQEGATLVRVGTAIFGSRHVEPR